MFLGEVVEFVLVWWTASLLQSQAFTEVPGRGHESYSFGSDSAWGRVPVLPDCCAWHMLFLFVVGRRDVFVASKCF